MSKIIGIDLGTTNSLCATVDSGIPYVIANPDGQRLTPSVVHFPAPNTPPVVGARAVRSRVLHPESTVYSIKRFIGRRGSDIPREEMLVTYPVRSDNNGSVTLPIHGRDHTPEEISAHILRQLKSDAETSLGEPVTGAVITVPAYFNNAQRNATKMAGELAGLKVERILNEPTAAALAYGLDKLKEQSRIAVYDLGGGTFDLSILELKEGVFQVLATNGNTRLGGDDIDRVIVDRLVQLIQEAGGPDATSNIHLISRVRESAEAAKIRLSTETETDITLPFLTPSFSFHHHMTREELEGLSREVVARTRSHCIRSLADAGVDARDLDQVILVGGQTRMPLVRRFVSNLFGCAEFWEERGGIRLGTGYHRPEGPQLNTSQNPDEAIALGAAIQAEILSGGFRNVLLLDVTPLSLGIETFGGLMNVIIHRNSTIPVKAGEIFTTAIDNQRNMLIHVLQGEREQARHNWSLGRFTIDFSPARRGVPRVGVQFEIDASGILHVLARDTATGREKVVEIKSVVDVDDAEVQKMVEESVEHAFDDLNTRRWVEARLQAGATITATRKGLADFAGELDPDYRRQIEAALTKIEAILADEDPKTESGDPAQLKKAAAELDEVTKPLADVMMDRAMEAMLKKRGIL